MVAQNKKAIQLLRENGIVVEAASAVAAGWSGV